MNQPFKGLLLFYRTRIAPARSGLYPGHRFRRSLVLDRGLEPAILCVRGRPPNHLEESSIIRAHLLTEMGVEPIIFRGREMSLPFDYSKKELLCVPYLFVTSLVGEETHFH